MWAKRNLLLPLGSLLLVFGIAIGCNKTRTDAQVASDVQTRITHDSSIQSNTIAVQAANGIVTLNGSVSTNNERAAAASDAASVDGVKTVVNNLEVTTNPVVQQAPPPASAPVPMPQARLNPPVEKAKPSARDRHRRNDSQEMSDRQIRQDLASSEAPPSQPGNVGAAAPAPVATTMPPAPPPPPAKVIIPVGTTLSVRLVDGLDSERNQVGDTFKATLNSPIVIDDQTVLPRDADLQGRVVDVKSAGRFAGGSNLTIELTSLSVNGKTYNIQTSQWEKKGTGQGKKTAVKTGGGAVLGAIIGGLAGGGRGAAIGTVAGGAAGAGTAAATNKANQIKLAPEALLSFSLQSSLTVTPQSSNDRNAGRTQLNQ